MAGKGREPAPHSTFWQVSKSPTLFCVLRRRAHPIGYGTSNSRLATPFPEARKLPRRKCLAGKEVTAAKVPEKGGAAFAVVIATSCLGDEQLRTQKPKFGSSILPLPTCFFQKSEANPPPFIFCNANPFPMPLTQTNSISFGIYLFPFSLPSASVLGD